MKISNDPKADAILTGTILQGRQQSTNMKDGSGAGTEKIIIKVLSF